VRGRRDTRAAGRRRLSPAAIARACLLGALAAGPGPGWAQASTAQSTTAQAAAPMPAPKASDAATAAAAVQLARLADVQVFPRREAPATVLPRNETRLSAEVSATVVAIEVDAAQPVRRGAVVVRLDDTDLKLALARARAQRESLAARLALAEVQLERGRELQRQNYVSADALAQREAEVASLRADLRASEVQVASAQRQVHKSLVRAPFDGAVRARHVQLGELVSPGAALLTLTQSGPTEVSAAVPAEDADRLARARDLAFESGAERLPLRLLRVAPMADRATRSREARLAFAGAGVAPGSEGRLLWRDPRPHLPAELLVRRGGVLGVFVAEGGRARFVAVPGAQEGRPAPAPAGLAGDVVTSGQSALQDGQPIAAR
jgi:RND family efflux transporter MFP subunit